jgi:PPP family 3-phenylpropionic acid transporter
MDHADYIVGGARRALPLRLYFFASFAALGVYSPFFPRWLTARGIDGVAMGAIVATIPAMGIIGPPLSGMCADALGLRGSLLRAACLGSTTAFAALALLGLYRQKLGFAEIFAAVLVFAVFRAPMLAMADVVAVEREHDGGASYGRTRLWGSVGFLLAAVCGGRYLDPESPTELPALVAAALFVALLGACALPVRSDAGRLPLVEQLHGLGSQDLRLLLRVAFVAEIALSSYELCFSLHLGDLGASSGFIGAAWALGVVVEILMMGAAGRLLSRFRAPVLVVAALWVTAARCALLATVRSLPVLMAAQALHSPAVALFWIAALSHLRERTSPRTFAAAQGLFAAVTAAGTVTGMLGWGALYHRVGGPGTFATAGVIAASAALLAARWAGLTPGR